VERIDLRGNVLNNSIIVVFPVYSIFLKFYKGQDFKHLTYFIESGEKTLRIK